MPKLIWYSENVADKGKDFDASSEYIFVNGVGNVWLVTRPYVRLEPRPPIEVIQVPENVVRNLDRVFAVDQSENLYLSSLHVKRISKNLVESVFTDESIGIEGSACVSPQGYVLAVNDHPFQFSILDSAGKSMVDGYELYYSNPDAMFAANDEPFWMVGAESISAGSEFFAVSGPTLGRIEIYSYTGSRLRVLTSCKVGNQTMPIGDWNVVVDIEDNIWTSTGTHIIRLSQEGNVLCAVDYQELIFDTFVPWISYWFGIDSMLNLWCSDEHRRYAGFSVL